MVTPSPELLQAQAEFDRALKRSPRFHLGLVRAGMRHYRATRSAVQRDRDGPEQPRPN